MGSDGDNRWRRVVGVLANDDARRVAGALFLGGDGSAELAGLSPSRRRHVTDALVGSGVADATGDGLALRPAVFAELLAADPARRARGVERFLRDGRIAQYPTNTAERGELLDWVARRALAPGEVVDEAGINERLGRFAENVAVLRRYLVDHGLVERKPDGSEYALVAEAVVRSSS